MKTRDFESLALDRKKSSPLTKLVKVPASVLLKVWTGKAPSEEYEKEDESGLELNKWTDDCSGPAKHAMKELDYSLTLFDQCGTIRALQQANLKVAECLLDVACQKECQNPFLCLHQAAVFASQGSKGGDNDDKFKKELPKRKEDCTVNQALSILGRADCLRAIHFTTEAMYLCSFVASVCRLHRDKKEREHCLTPKWIVVGIQMYLVSVAINGSLHSLMDEEEAKYAIMNGWDKATRKEIERARSDAKVVLQQARISPGFSSVQLSRKNSMKNKWRDDDNTSLQNMDDIDLNGTTKIGEAVIDSDDEAQNHPRLNSDGDEEFSFTLEEDESVSESNEESSNENDDVEGFDGGDQRSVEMNEATKFVEIEEDMHMEIPDEEYGDVDYVAL